MPEETPPPRLLAGWVRTDHPVKLNRAGSYVMLTTLAQVPNGQSLLLRSEGRSIRIADNSDDSGDRSGKAFSRFVRADINDRNEVAFVARMNNSTMAAFVFREGRIRALSGLRTVGGGVDDIAINSSGMAIYGDLTGLWSGPDLNADRIIGRGDTLLGKQVQLVRLLGLNEAGQIFFAVGFGGSSVFTSLVRADPR